MPKTKKETNMTDTHLELDIVLGISKLFLDFLILTNYSTATKITGMQVNRGIFCGRDIPVIYCVLLTWSKSTFRKSERCCRIKLILRLSFKVNLLEKISLKMWTLYHITNAPNRPRIAIWSIVEVAILKIFPRRPLWGRLRMFLYMWKLNLEQKIVLTKSGRMKP